MPRQSRPVVAVGQLWKVNGITYRVESLDGPEGPHWPIIMVETARDPHVNREIRAQYDGTPAAVRELTLESAALAPRSMNIELRWFEVRTAASCPADARAVRVADCGDSGCRYAARPLRGVRSQSGKCRCDEGLQPHTDRAADT